MTKKAKSILLFSTADWDNPFWTNKQHMAVQFARNGYKVLYVDSLGLRLPTMGAKDLLRMGKRLLKAIPIPRKVHHNVWRVSPLVIPFHSNPHIRRFNEILLATTMRWYLFLLGFKNPLIWTYNPMLNSLIKKLSYTGVVYHCVDDLSAAPGLPADEIRESEQELGAYADLCFTTSRELQNIMTPFFRETHYESNVCDVDHFSKAQETLPEPDDLANIPHPRLLFIGALSQYKVDFKLIEAVAQKMPEIHWVLIGQIGEGQPGSSSPPIHLKNVHHLGPRSYASLPAYLRHADVAVLPSTLNKYTASMFPMKFFEYLAAGLPIVGSKLPSLKEHQNLYFPTGTPEEFLEAVSKALSGERRDQGDIAKACEYHSMDARFLRMESVFSALWNK